MSLERETMVVLTINNIDCYYESLKIIEQVNFSVSTGNFIGILGPNGSGKTTLLRSISRTLKPYKGTILLDNSDIYNLKAVDVAKQLAVVSQGTVIAFSFTALDVVLMGRSPHLSRFAMESEKDVEIAKKCMEYTGTWHLANRLITELSGGERQRVIIAKALAQEPKVLLLDEPTTHLDMSNQLEIMDILKNLCLEKKLLIVGVFHDFNLAAHYCDSLILLKEGKVANAGKSEEVLTSDNIKKIFAIDTVVKQNPITKSLYVIPISKKRDKPTRRLSVHLICGAGTGSSLMKLLTDDGYTVTAGVLNIFDTDQETAIFLKIPIIDEVPLSPISDFAYQKNLNLIGKTDIVILTSFPFGLGNLKNIDAANFAINRKIPTFVLEETPIETRDFTNGEAKEKMLKIKQNSICVKNENELFNALKIFSDKMKENKNGLSAGKKTAPVMHN